MLSAPQEDEAAQLQAFVEAQLAPLDPAERAQIEIVVRELVQRLSQMSTEEQTELLAAQARDGAIAARRGEIAQDELIARLEEVAAQAAAGGEPGSPWAELAEYLRAVVALLRGEDVPPVPAAYAAYIAEILA